MKQKRKVVFRRVRDFKPRPGAKCPAGKPYHMFDRIVCIDDTETALVKAGAEYVIEKVDGHMLVITVNGCREYMRADRFRRA